SFWHWFILGIVLTILEILAPGVVVLWLGIAAGVTGLAVLGIDGLTWQVQILVFAGLSVVSVVSGRLWMRHRPSITEHPTLNRRGERHIGRVFTLDAPIVNGVGKIRVDDATWKVTGDDLPAGARVKVIAAEGTILRVERE
ncbi:MAG: NfeD family protein, partial [Rhodospirillales bacterium]|nr:NfeD family protein [Rhodospirillales bacterium]